MGHENIPVPLESAERSPFALFVLATFPLGDGNSPSRLPAGPAAPAQGRVFRGIPWGCDDSSRQPALQLTLPLWLCCSLFPWTCMSRTHRPAPIARAAQDATLSERIPVSRQGN